VSETSTTETISIDGALQFAVIDAWNEVAKATTPRFVRVEYLREPGLFLDHVSVWLVKTGGYQNLVCDYWTQGSTTHPYGLCFVDRHHSDKLTHTLDFIMENQGQFRPHAVDAGSHGLVRVFPPTEEDRVEAATWIAGIQGSVAHFAAASN
jgi:hypothetical protein